MKKLVFATLFGSMALPALGSAQDAPPTPAPEVAQTETTTESHQEMSAGHEVEEPTEVEEGSWTDRLTYNIFADAFYMVDWNRPQVATATSAVPHRAYDYTDGFGLAFAGVDAMYHGEHFGATVSLRYGIGAERYLIGGVANASGMGGRIASAVPALGALKQGFGSIMPTDKLTIDVGLWDTPYGAEVADSWVNFNYTRSPLNYLMQPFYHLGARVTYQATDEIVVKGFLANATNAYSGTNTLPYLGTQVGYAGESFAVYGGYMTGQLGRGGDFEHFVDVVGTVTLGDFALVANFDLWKNPAADASWGASLVAHYQISDMFGVAVRGDFLKPSDYFGYLYDPDLTDALDQSVDTLAAATATLDFRPWEDNVILRLEHRIEFADQDIFADSDGASDIWNSTTLSAVIRTGN